MSVDNGMGNYAGDDDLESIENGTLPGTNNVQKIIGSLRSKLAQDNPVNTDTNINKTERVDLSTPPKAQNPLDLLGLGEGFSTPVDYTLPTRLQSAANPMGATPAATAPTMPTMQQDPSAASVTMPGQPPMDNPTSNPAAMGTTGSFNAIAYVIENGEVKCASCENYYIPESEAHVKAAHCGAPDCHDEREEEEMKNADGVWVSSKLHRNVEEGDVVDGRVIKTTDEETRLASTDDYLNAFNKEASDSQLYYRGYEDAKAGRPLDEDLAELSDDYFHGYDQFKFYHIGPQQSVPQSLYDIKPNSNNNPRMTQGEVDAGPNQLTDGHSFATHASKTASIHHHCDAIGPNGETCTESYQPSFSRGSEFDVPDNWASCIEPEGEFPLHFCPKHADIFEQIGHELTTEPELSWKRSWRGSYFHHQDREPRVSKVNDNLKEANDWDPLEFAHSMQNNQNKGQNQPTFGPGEGGGEAAGAGIAEDLLALANKKVSSDPLGFAHALEQSQQMKREKRRNMVMNMALMVPVERELGEVNESTCRLCNELGHDDDHASHRVFISSKKPVISSKLPFPTDVIERFFRD